MSEELKPCPFCDEAMELIMSAAPLAWLWNEPRGPYIESAAQWEKDAEDLIKRYKEANQ